jgi:DNA repair exonuclease SbcCD ATPase subunit
MKLLNLHAHNVFSIGTIDLDLTGKGLVLVTGWSNDENTGNMAGKSCVANRTIVWGLYGRTVDGIKADDVINTSIKNAKHCGVRIHFEGIDGKEYRIYRARKPNCLVLSIKNAFEEVWTDLSKRNEKDTQELINALLGRDHKTFIQSDFFGQGRERSFLALPGSEQKAVVEEILPLNSLEKWKDKAKEELKLVEERVEAAEIEQCMSHERKRTALSHYHTLQSQEAGWNTNNAIELNQAQKELNKILCITENIEDEIEVLKESIPGTPARTLEEQIVIERVLSQSINSLGYRIDTLTGDIDRRASRPEICVSCEQTLPKERVELNAEALKNDRAKREELIAERGEKEAKQYLAASYIAICHEIQGLEVSVKVKSQRAALEEKVRILVNATNPFAHLVYVADKQVKAEQIINEETELQVLEMAEEREHYRFWANAFGHDLKTMIFNQVCPYLERQTNQYLRDLDNAQIKVKFRTVKLLKSGDARDQFCVTAASDTGSKVFELFSGAEKQLTSFAVGMALSDLAGMQVEGASSFMILDEPFLYQSPENCERIINFITTHLVSGGEGGKTVLLISNEDNLVNLVHDRVHVVKEKGVTYIA